tara:strand:+ start:37 stop:669 length:633 start_codon:yes stop_codon:yes gene_type:complete
MPVTINGNGSITGLSVGGLGSGVVNTATIASNAITSALQPAGSVIQANSAVLTTVLDAYLSSMTTWRIGGTTGSSFGVTITPTSASNKILFWGQISVSVTGPQYNIGCHVMKYTGSGSSEIIDGSQAVAAGSRKRCHSITEMNHSDNSMQTVPFSYLDTAGQTSQLIYTVGIHNPSSTTRTTKINATITDADNTYTPRAASVLNVLEIKA